MDIHGVLVIDKPAGPTSHDVVARVRRALGVRRIGHTGTLDPLATGVLPLVIGRATRLSSLLSGAAKEYEAAVRFGSATPTYDAEGRMVRDPERRTAAVVLPPPPAPAGLAAEDISAALDVFRGTFAQTPPPFSAKKVEGVPAYKRARREDAVTPAAVTVTVRSLRLLDYDAGLARLAVACSAGFYVRSLAHDLGARLGCGAHLEALRRTRAGEFGIDAAVPLEQVEAEGPPAAARMIGLAGLLPHVPHVVLGERGVRRASHGNDVGPADLAAPGPWSDGSTAGADARRVRLLDTTGTLLGIAERTPDGLLHPVVVLV
jgi:tRNA pseudouridine55 synthase